jgi:trimethylamine--corrinoid protein Co-methyltransferase
MACVVAGGGPALRAAPPISALLGTVTPLGNDAGTLEAGLVFAAAGVPVGFVTMPMGGSTTPITMAGSLVVGIAEALAAVCVIQAAHPGAAVFICFIPSVMDLKTGDFTGGAPEDTLMASAVADVGHFYELPTQCGINSSGAKEPGWQSAIDDTSTTYLSLAAGVDMLTGVGMVHGGRIFSLAEMALAVETISVARDIAAGIALRDEVLSAASLAAAASGKPPARAGADSRAGGARPAPADGQAPLIDDEACDAWVAAGRTSALDRAQARVREIVATHVPPALDPTTDAELRRLAAL